EGEGAMKRRIGVGLAAGGAAVALVVGGLAIRQARQPESSDKGLEELAASLDDLSALNQLDQLGRFGPPPPGASTTLTEARSVEGSTERTVRYGPIPLAAGTATTPSQAAAFVAGVEVPCADCYVTGVRPDLVYEDGRSANLDTGVMLHHLVLVRANRPDPTCTGESPLADYGQRFFGAGNERTHGDFPAGFGYHLEKDPIHAIYEIMNHEAADKAVYLSVKVTYVPDTQSDMKAVTPIWLDENNCATSEYTVPAGPSKQGTRWTSSISGQVVAAAGHVHDGGVKTVLTNESRGEHLCTSTAGYEAQPSSAHHHGSLASMSLCVGEPLGTVRTGEVLLLDTYYDVAESKSDVMGIMLAYVHEGEVAETPGK
ncbi:MAG: hypothetical protein ACRDV9_07345, partial [Acidimicrobiia bacterium]